MNGTRDAAVFYIDVAEMLEEANSESEVDAILDEILGHNTLAPIDELSQTCRELVQITERNAIEVDLEC